MSTKGEDQRTTLSFDEHKRMSILSDLLQARNEAQRINAQSIISFLDRAIGKIGPIKTPETPK